MIDSNVGCLHHSLAGRVAIVTGAAQGLGASISRQMSAAGAKVVLSDINDAAGRAVAQEIGEGAIFVHHDVSNLAGWQAPIAAAEATFGPVSILVNNAGIALFETLEHSPEGDIRRVIEVNQLGVLFGMQSILPSMRKAGGGSIVNIASIAGLRGTGGLSVYSSCKWAVRGLTKCAALELGSDNIRVNAVHPGVIETPLTEQLAAPQDQPLKRKGRPEEVAQAVVYLASDQSSYITGCDLVVDGGRVIASS